MKNILKLNMVAYEAIRSKIGASSTELEVYKTISKAFDTEVGQHIDFLCDIISGERSIDVEGRPTERILKNGDTLIVDILPRYNGIYSDTTRTFFVGEPSKRQVEIYEILLCALENGKQLLIEGVTAQAVHKAVMESISCKGLGHFFPHHAGHRIGQESLMKPDFIEGNTQTLEAGMYVTLEPGIYLPNEFGIRVENNYLITKTGCELLFDYPLNIDYFTLKG